MQICWTILRLVEMILHFCLVFLKDTVALSVTKLDQNGFWVDLVGKWGRLNIACHIIRSFIISYPELDFPSKFHPIKKLSHREE